MTSEQEIDYSDPYMFAKRDRIEYYKIKAKLDETFNPERNVENKQNKQDKKVNVQQETTEYIDPYKFAKRDRLEYYEIKAKLDETFTPERIIEDMQIRYENEARIQQAVNSFLEVRQSINNFSSYTNNYQNFNNSNSRSSNIEALARSAISEGKKSVQIGQRQKRGIIIDGKYVEIDENYSADIKINY